MNLLGPDLLKLGALKLCELPAALKELAKKQTILPIMFSMVQRFPDDESFLEAGMTGYISGVELDETFDDGSSLCRVHCYFGDHYDHNKKLFKKVFNDNFGKPTLTALDKNLYKEYENFLIDGTVTVSDYIRLIR